MQLTETHQIGKNHRFYDELAGLTRLSKNLYNACLYDIRQYFFETKKYKSYATIAGEFAKANPDYKALPAKVSQQVLRLVDQNFRSFFGLLKKKLKANIPNYLDKAGHYSLIYTKQALSFKDIGYVKLSGTNIKIKTNKENINQIRISPRNDHFSVEIIYSIPDTQPKDDNGLYAAIDLGLNNLMTCVTNICKPVIYNGRPIKAINHFYNKMLAKQKSIQEKRNQGKSTNKTRQMTRKRNNKISDYMHKISKALINHAVLHDISTIFIGESKKWKQEINLGARNNQNFVQMPFSKLVQMIEYKGKMNGINVLRQEESYTSKASFLSNDLIPVYGDKNIPIFSGHRVKRGLYNDRNHGMINADVNGAANILRKAVGDTKIDPIQVCSTPAVFTAKLC